MSTADFLINILRAQMPLRFDGLQHPLALTGFSTFNHMITSLLRPPTDRLRSRLALLIATCKL
jgi:hypothetical protein